MGHELPEGATLIPMAPTANSGNSNFELPEGATLLPAQETPKREGFLANTFGPINDYIKNNNFLGLQTMDNLSHETAKGIPIAGGFVRPDTQENKDFQSNHPLLSAIAPVGANIAATAPLAAGSLALTKAKPAYEFATQVGPKAFEATKAAVNPILQALKNTTGLATTGAAVGGLDAAAKGGSLEDIKSEAGINALGMGAGPLLGKVLSPGINISDNAAKSIAILGGAAGGFGLGHSLEASVLGLLTGEAPYSSAIIKKLLANKALSSPNSAAILSAIGGKAADTLTSPSFRGYENAVPTGM